MDLSLLAHQNNEFLLLVSGTPISNDVYDAFDLLYYIDPTIFSIPKGIVGTYRSARDAFADDYGDSDQNPIERLSSIYRPYLIRHNSDVLSEDQVCEATILAVFFHHLSENKSQNTRV
jgi:hypothetical protein